MTAPETPHIALDDLMAQRRAKLAAARARGENPFPTRFDDGQRAADVLARHADLPAAGHGTESVAFAGRLMTRRDMGKTIFAHLQDLSGRLQIYLKKDELGDAFAAFQDTVDLGDHVGATGFAVPV